MSDSLPRFAVTMAVQTRVLDERLAAMFVRELQRAVARDDRAAVSALIQYPLTVFAGGLRIPIPDTAVPCSRATT
jgi:hypothetical protein